MGTQQMAICLIIWYYCSGLRSGPIIKKFCFILLTGNVASFFFFNMLSCKIVIVIPTSQLICNENMDWMFIFPQNLYFEGLTSQYGWIWRWAFKELIIYIYIYIHIYIYIYICTNCYLSISIYLSIYLSI